MLLAISTVRLQHWCLTSSELSLEKLIVSLHKLVKEELCYVGLLVF